MQKAAALVLCALTVLQGCAYGTLLRGSDEEVEFTSRPPGATVRIDDQVIGETPISWTLKRKKDTHRIGFEMQGCGSKTIRMHRELSPIIVANLVPFLTFGFLIGTLVDLTGGGGFNLEPNPVYVSLACDSEPSPTDGVP